jgi:hypothetical protein
VSDEDQEDQVVARQNSDKLEEVRAWGERNEKRVKELADENAQLRQSARAMGLRAAEVDPESWLGRTVLAAAEANDMTSIEDITNLTRLVQADARGGN